LKDFLCQAVSEYKEKGLSLSLANNSFEIFAEIDVVQLRSILNNILENSVKYKVNDNVKSEIIYAEKGGHIVISITDDGPGVPKESIDKLFDIFYRSAASRNDPSNGSGLDLAMVKKIIERFLEQLMQKTLRQVVSQLLSHCRSQETDMKKNINY